MRSLSPKNKHDSGNESATTNSERAANRHPQTTIASLAASFESTSAKPKRVVVSNACVPCRKRRSKCDASLPCAKCTALNRGADCHFDAENDHRRKGALRRENDTLKRKNLHLDAIFLSIASSNDAELESIVKRIRTGENFEDIANGIRAGAGASGGASDTTTPGSSSTGGDSPDQGSGASTDETDEAGPLGRPCLDKSEESQSQPGGHDGTLAVRPSSWTDVTDDDAFVLELVDLYFTWHHPFFHLLSESRFRADFATGRLVNCSSLLVNAILATACSYSDSPGARLDPADDDSVGEHFVNEAKRIFEKGGKRTITTIQALPIMAIRESGMGRDLMGRWYLSLAYRLVCDSSYNQILVPQQMQKNEFDEEAWRITFWGCYNLETMWNFGLGRPNKENAQCDKILKPTPTDETELTPWVPYTAHTPKSDLKPVGPSLTYTIINALTDLCQITQEITRWLYANKPFKAGTLLGFHARLIKWQDDLPDCIKEVREDSILAILNLHAFHRTVVLALFRPFVSLPFEPAKNFLSPRELAGIASREAVQILRIHHRAWGFRRAHGMIYQYLIPMCNARQLEFPLPDAREDYMFGVRGMKEAGIAWPFGKIALLSMAEIKDLPEEKKKPNEEIESMLNRFQELSVERKTEMTHNSDYYTKIIENNPAGLASDFEYHWRHEWVKFVAGLIEGADTAKGHLGTVKKPSVESLLN